jgi:hypothetical protein
MDRESIVIEIIPTTTSETAHVCILKVKNFDDSDDSDEDNNAVKKDILEIVEGKDSIYRVPYEIDIKIFHSDEHKPFNYEDDEDMDEHNIEEDELKAFEFTKKGLKAENEMEGINVRLVLIMFRLQHGLMENIF